jgi:hypothetical protein
MDQQELEIYDGIVVPASALRQEQRRTRYGNLADLPDEELADPEELERVMYKQMWWPILRLPQQRWECRVRPNMDEDGRLDWGAFGTVDFDSYRPQHSRLRYRIEQLKERLKDQSCLLRMMSDRVPGKTKYKIMRLVRTGVLDIGAIENNEMYFLVAMYLRVWRLRREIEHLREKSREQQEAKVRELWASPGC